MKINIGGIKFSGELIHVSYRPVSPSDGFFVDLIRRIAEKRINIPFMCSGVFAGLNLSTLCIAASDFPFLERLLDIEPMLDEMGRSRLPEERPGYQNLQILQHIGTLTLFPHRRSLTLPGRVVASLSQAGIVIHSLCTSISAVAINIDYHLLDAAVELLGTIVELPTDHAPFRPEFCVRQISP